MTIKNKLINKGIKPISPWNTQYYYLKIFWICRARQVYISLARFYLNHIYHRLRRVTLLEAVPEKLSLLQEVQQFYDDQWYSIQNILSLLSRTYSHHTTASSYKQHSTSNPTLHHGDTDGVWEEPRSNSQPSSVPTDIGCTIRVTRDRGLFIYIQTKYDGKSGVRAYIAHSREFRLAKGMMARWASANISVAYELSYLQEMLFTGIVALKTPLDSWDALLDILKLDFEVMDFDYRMLEEIRT